MRARHFIVEYDRAKTWNVHAKGIIDAMFKDWSAISELGDLRAYIKDLTSPPYHKAIENPAVMSDIMAMIEKGDPTKNKQYSQWLARMYSKNIIPLEDIQSKMFDALTKFHTLKLKKQIKPQHSDLNQMKRPVDLLTAMSHYEDPEDEVKDKGNSAEIYNDDKIRVIVPKDETAACYYGQGTRWCTAGRTGNMFKRYHEDGDMYIVLPKKPQYDGEKYQLHLQSKQFMDEQDRPVKLLDLVIDYPGLTKIPVINKWAKIKQVPELMNDEDYKDWKEYTTKSLKFAGKSIGDDLYTVNLNAPNGNFTSGDTMMTLESMGIMDGRDWKNFYVDSGLSYAIIDQRTNECQAVVAMDYTSSDDYSDGGVFIISNDDFDTAGSGITDLDSIEQLKDALKELNQYHYDSTHSLRDPEEFDKKYYAVLDKYGYPFPHRGFVGGEPERS